MTHEAVGLNTGKVYMKGSKEDCFRNLNEKYPSSLGFYEGSNREKKLNLRESLYPEPLMVRRKS